MSNFQVEFTLKQHTPIIHFQSEQRGATLRATELKPKLDRFLLKTDPGLPHKDHANGASSLDYKVKIISTLTTTDDIDKKDPLFFGNMGDGEKKRFVMAKKVVIRFSSFDAIILGAIKAYFEAFIAQTNFGTRQSKGFGSFYVDNKPFKPELIPFKTYSFTSNSWKKDIKLFYSFLRAGINTADFGGIYAKAVIFSYAKSQSITWDKKAIKETYLGSQLKEQQDKYPEADSCVTYKSDDKRLVRDLFGLSSEQSWKSYNATITKENKDIDRFKSPITFKVVDKKVYFWADKSVESILNKRFKIAFNRKNNLELDTPQQFSFDDFFEYAFDIDLATYIESRYHKDRHKEYLTLSRIFSDIKANK